MGIRTGNSRGAGDKGMGWSEAEEGDDEERVVFYIQTRRVRRGDDAW